jgi:protein-disulfide isomerase
MAITLKKTALTLTALVTLAVTPAFAEDPAFTDAQKDALGGLIKGYLMENPGVIFEAIEAHRMQQQVQQQQQAEEKIGEHIQYLTRADSPSIGNPEGDVTVVEFFDYNCGYCKRALPDIQAALKDDQNVRFVFQEMPILGPTSKTAALWALAAHKQGKYFDYHVALMEHKGPKDDAQLEKLATDTGLDAGQMKKDIESGDLEKELDKIVEVAREIGVSGTPAFIVGETFVPGYIGEDGLKQAIKEERQKMKDGG